MNNLTDSSSIDAYPSYNTVKIDSTRDTPDYSYSWKSIALIITSVALFAIMIVSIGLLATHAIPLGLAIAGVTVPFWPACGAFVIVPDVHRREIAQREFDFAESKTEAKIKNKYYKKAAEKGHAGAIQKEYERGKALLLKAAKEIDEKSRAEKLDKGLKVFEKSARHSMGNKGAYKGVFNRERNLQNQFKTQFNNTVGKGKSTEKLIEKYWNHILESALKAPHFPLAMFWTPESYSRF